jgi:Flp pilus assembly CpaE family ATPase
MRRHDTPPQRPSFESVDTQLHDPEDMGMEEVIEEEDVRASSPRPNLKVVSFSGNLDPQTHEYRLPPELEPPAPAARPVPRHPQQPGAGFDPQQRVFMEMAPHGRLLVYFGCRGGAGATMLAVNSAAALARAGRSVCLVDLDLQLGDINTALNIDHPTSIAALAREAKSIDAAALKRRLARHDSGVYALTQTARLDDIDPQLAEKLPEVFKLLLQHFEYVIVDGVRDFGDFSLAALDAADRVALVVTQDVAAVRRAARVTQIFRQLGYPERKVQLVVNRQSDKALVPESEIERVCQLPITATVRNDYARTRQAMDEGSLLTDVARNAPVTRDVETMATSIFADRVPAQNRRDDKPGFFARLFGRT